MNFIENIKDRARKQIKSIVLPEAEDLRILKAAEVALEEKYANIILIGNKEKILESAKVNNIDIEEAEIIDPRTSENYERYVKIFYELRKHKGITIEEAKKIVLDPVYFGMLMVKDEETNIENGSRCKIGFCFFCYGSTRLRIWFKWNIHIWRFGIKCESKCRRII